MKRVLSPHEMRAVDAESERHGVLSEVLMLNAGTALAQEALAQASGSGRFVVLCGTGNNGGDGWVAAMALARAGRRVFAELIGEPHKLKGEPRRLYESVTQVHVHLGKLPPEETVGPGDVVIDAIYGTGLSRAPSGAAAEAIGRIAQWKSHGAKVVAADVPSGLDSETGRILEPCVRADVTVSFGFFKTGQMLEPGLGVCGTQRCVEIGLPPKALGVAVGLPLHLVEEIDVVNRLPPRRADSHKGTYGHVLVVAGSEGKSGAAALAGLAALRGGAGLVTIAARRQALAQSLAHAPELMGHALEGSGALGLADLEPLTSACEGKQAIVFGPGIERGPETSALICALLHQAPVPWVLDADGLNAFAGQAKKLNGLIGRGVLTPHPGEMARLLGITTADVGADRLGAARKLALDVSATVVLKGARTITADASGGCYLNPTGNAGMATGGSGDVLSGLCGALMAQGLSGPDAAMTAVYAHGLAGDLAVAETGQLGLVASDLVRGLTQVWARWKR